MDYDRVFCCRLAPQPITLSLIQLDWQRGVKLKILRLFAQDLTPTLIAKAIQPSRLVYFFGKTIFRALRIN